MLAPPPGMNLPPALEEGRDLIPGTTREALVRVLEEMISHLRLLSVCLGATQP